MGKPKKRTSARKSAFRQSHDVEQLAKDVNGRLSNIGSPVKVYTAKIKPSRKAVSTK